ncbi:MAG: LptF/LptG family permease [Planctomycetota bacterium]|jgi:LPS export ABC transporter permease LptG
MFFKRVDRYVGWSFLLRFAGIICLLSILYTTFDLLKRLEDLQQDAIGQTLPMLAAYYCRLVPVFVLDIVPGIVLVAAGMVLVRMSKRRELLALKACGTSIYRVTAPIFFWTLVISILAFMLKEALGPQLIQQRESLSRAIDGKVGRRLMVSDASADRRVFVGEYDFARQTMETVWVLDFYPEGMLKRATQADAARWSGEGKLLLESVRTQYFRRDSTAEPEASLSQTKEIRVDLTPLDFLQAAEEERDEGMRFRTLPELRRQIRRLPEVPYFRVAFHSRLASFFGPLILLLVGVPCLIGFERSVNSRFLGLIVSMLVAGGLFGLTFVFSSMGNTGALNPVLAGWLPAVIVGAGGLWLFESMLT